MAMVVLAVNVLLQSIIFVNQNCVLHTGQFDLDLLDIENFSMCSTLMTNAAEPFRQKPVFFV